jgi:colicin import membrane protein
LSETIERPEANALVVAGSPVTAITLFAKGGVETLLSRLEAEVRAVKRDISTPKGRKEIKSLAFKVARSKTALDEMGKELNESKRAEINAVDADRRIIRERCDALKAEVTRELDEYEAQEAARIKGHEDALKVLSEFAHFDAEPSSEEVRQRIGQLDVAEDSRQWQEFAQRANELHAEVGFKLTEALAAAVAREEAAAEAERRRLEAEEAARQEAARLQREREARIAAEAAEKARVDAERRAAESAAAERQRVEQERLDAEDRAREAELAAQAELDALEEANRIASERAREAEERAARAERESIAAERRAEEQRKAAAEQAERDRQAAVEAERKRVAAEKAEEERAAAARARNQEIKRRVNFDAAADFIVAIPGISEDMAKAVVIAIAKGQIRNVSIRY